MWYDVGLRVLDGRMPALELGGQSTTAIDQVALAFTIHSDLPSKVYEQALTAER